MSVQFVLYQRHYSRKKKGKFEITKKAFARKRWKLWNITTIGFQEGEINIVAQHNTVLTSWFDQNFAEKTDGDLNISASTQKIITPEKDIDFELDNNSERESLRRTYFEYKWR